MPPSGWRIIDFVSRGWDTVVGFGLAAWVVGFGYHWLRPNLWVLDVVLVPLGALLYVGGLAAVVVGAVGGRRLPLIMGLVPAVVVATAVVNPGWRVAPRTWFALHRPLFEMALSTEPGPGYYGTGLPLPLRFLTADGHLSSPQAFDDGVPNRRSEVRFFPQWIGVPDDAGGYLYAPDGPPTGLDMYGMECTKPVALGGDWWMCGL